MRITSSESKDNLVRSGKGLITSLSIKSKSRPKKYRKARYAIGNVSKKDLSNIIREFYKLPYNSYESRRPKHEHIDSYFYLARQLVKCMMRYDALNSHVYPVRTEMTAPSLNVNIMDKDESKRIIVHESLSDNCSTDVSESKRNVVNETLLQNNSVKVSEYNITELKDKEYK